MKKFEIKQWYEAKECECGGVFSERFDQTMLLVDPPKSNFRCNKCGAVVQLDEAEWPGLRTEIIGLNT